MPEPSSSTPGARVHLVTGKGGVGKTSVALALGRSLAARGARTLVLDLGPGLGLRAALEAPVGHAPSALGSGLAVAATEAARAIDDAVLAFSPSRRAAARLLRVASLRAFLGAAPGVLEVAVLHRVERLAASGAYDAVVVDADASGHVRMLLDAPELLRSVGAAGPVRRALDAASALLTDPERTRVHVVTLPTTLALEESSELVAALVARRAPLDSLLVSRAPAAPDLDAEAARALLRRGEAAAPAEDLRALLGTLAARARLAGFLAREGGRFRRVIELPEDEGRGPDVALLAEVGP